MKRIKNINIVFLKRKLSELYSKTLTWGYKKLLPSFYIFVVIFGLVLTGIHYAFFPKMFLCSSFFGEQICTPAGIFIVVLASLPGYLIAGNILKFLTEIPGFTSFVVIFLSSVLFYFGVGYLVDKKRQVPFTTAGVAKIIVFGVFIFLIFALLAFI